MESRTTRRKMGVLRKIRRRTRRMKSAKKKRMERKERIRSGELGREREGKLKDNVESHKLSIE